MDEVMKNLKERNSELSLIEKADKRIYPAPILQDQAQEEKNCFLPKMNCLK